MYLKFVKISRENSRVMEARILELSNNALKGSKIESEFALGQLVGIYDTAQLLGWKNIEQTALRFIQAVDLELKKN